MNDYLTKRAWRYMGAASCVHDALAAAYDRGAPQGEIDTLHEVRKVVEQARNNHEPIPAITLHLSCGFKRSYWQSEQDRKRDEGPVTVFLSDGTWQPWEMPPEDQTA
jgi:hypothetical protein